MNFLYKILVATALVATCSAQEGRNCHTESITPRHFFNMTDFIGTWYMHKFSVGDPEADLTPDYKCLSVNYTATSNPYNYLTAERYIQQHLNGSSTIVQESSLVVIDNIVLPAYWKVYSNSGAVETDTVILHTDYESWSVVYTCQKRGENGTYRHESATIWTREPLEDSRLDDFTTTLLIGFGFPPDRHYTIDQTDC